MVKKCIILWRYNEDLNLQILDKINEEIRIFENRNEAIKEINGCWLKDCYCQIVELQI